MKEENVICCVVGCKKEAEWELHCGNEVSDVTESCSSHIGELISAGDSRGREVNGFTGHRI